MWWQIHANSDTAVVEVCMVVSHFSNNEKYILYFRYKNAGMKRN